MNGTVQAGAAAVEITPGVGIPMGGYGARVGDSSGLHDPLYARALVLSDGSITLALVVCDLVGLPDELAAQARARIATQCGIPEEQVAISATHTHSGPLLRREGIEPYLDLTAQKIAGAVQLAQQSQQPVTLKLGEASVTTISQNRRSPEGPIETVARILVAAPTGGATPVATLVNYACHATVLEHDNLLYSADFPGAAVQAVERAVGGVGIYLQGAAGNINPVWMRHDFAEVERIGGILGAAAARTAHELRPLGEGQWAVNLSWSENTPKEPAPGAVLGDVRLAAARRWVELTRRELPPLGEIEAEIAALEEQLAAAGEDTERRRALRPRLNALRMDRAQQRGDPAAPGTRERIELQAFRISGECAVLLLPGEFFVELAREIEAAAGLPHLLIGGYANGTPGYVPTPETFAEGGYEAGRARFAPDSAALLVSEAAALVRSLYNGQ